MSDMAYASRGPESGRHYAATDVALEGSNGAHAMLIGSARLALSKQHPGQLNLPIASRGDRPNPWEALQWVVNLLISGQKPEFRHAIERGEDAGDSEVYVEPLAAIHDETSLRDWWTTTTGLDSEPHPMILGASFARAQLLIPQPVLARIVELLDGERHAPAK